jgi:hypothetical protein
MPIYQVTLMYESQPAAGFDDQATLTVHGEIEDVQKAALKFYEALGIPEHERYASNEIYEDIAEKNGTNLQVDMDGAISNFVTKEIVLEAPGRASVEVPGFK